MEFNRTDEENPRNHADDAPPIWWQHRDRGPARRISHAIITIDGKRAGRVNRPEVMELSSDSIADLYPVLYDIGGHEVRIDFRSDTGRGSLAHITYSEGEREHEREQTPTIDKTPLDSMVEWAGRVMMQNERLQKQLLEAITNSAANTVDSHERLVTLLAGSMERDRTRQTDWMEREAALRQASFDRQSSVQTSNNDQQRAIMEMIAPLLANQGGGALGEVQDAITEKITDSLMEKVELMGKGAGSDKGVVEGLLESLGPVLASKLMPAQPEPGPAE